MIAPAAGECMAACPKEPELAVHSERITVLQGSVTELRDDFKGMREDIHAIRMMLSEVRGGWKVSMRVAAIAGAIVALIAETLLRKAAS